MTAVYRDAHGVTHIANNPEEYLYGLTRQTLCEAIAQGALYYPSHTLMPEPKGVVTCLRCVSWEMESFT